METQQFVRVVGVGFRVSVGVRDRDTAGFPEVFLWLLAIAYLPEPLEFFAIGALLPQILEIIAEPILHFALALVAKLNKLVEVKYRVTNHVILLSVPRLS